MNHLIQSVDIGVRKSDGPDYSPAAHLYFRALKDTYHCACMLDAERGNNVEAPPIGAIIERLKRERHGSARANPPS